ncbi:hypothetical protein FEQ05_06256 [Burkholderia pseudomultivorans]|uniref:Uncharacterized protein n=1 Tax=Burkholderia pseudomultivorans TaxID=1207504 RepID=A0ABU2EEB1_9BURK|nr:hypothetical protein [Burkholderia pseudomultivorans]TCT27250.1 hypothetical protein EC918_1162 [Burkholderia vietnamiensis]MDR8739119.1 hypothetical protein [Burkholderia pseudomultivorans]MDR8745797.1 hypothetical protein [Burkholderia pseudomultivorans]MDR8758235.1 hypothetical protein [Burkholderia pseudomultivorans]
MLRVIAGMSFPDVITCGRKRSKKIVLIIRERFLGAHPNDLCCGPLNDERALFRRLPDERLNGIFFSSETHNAEGVIPFKRPCPDPLTPSGTTDKNPEEPIGADSMDLELPVLHKTHKPAYPGRSPVGAGNYREGEKTSSDKAPQIRFLLKGHPIKEGTEMIVR